MIWRERKKTETGLRNALEGISKQNPIVQNEAKKVRSCFCSWFFFSISIHQKMIKIRLILDVLFSICIFFSSSLTKLILNSTRTTFIQMCELISKSFNRIQSNANYSKMTNLTVPKGILNNCKLELQKKNHIYSLKKMTMYLYV